MAGLHATLAAVFPAQRPVAAQPSRELPLIIGWGAILTLSLVMLVLLAGQPLTAIAAEPSPILIDPLDPRAEGEGPGLVGDPLLAALVVLLLGALAAALAAAYVRLVRSR